MNIPISIKEYLNSRAISDAIIEQKGIFWDGNRIGIPVIDKEGRVLFNKYRRSPFSEIGPKYQYDRGSKTELYNLESLNQHERIVITEGEFDALVLESFGIAAVSSTGGSGTFKEEWVSHFKNRDLGVQKEIFICYDNDSAGGMGAIKVQELLPEAKIIELPDHFGIKDVTDYFTKGIKNALPAFISLMVNARSYTIPRDTDSIDELKNQLDKAVIDRRNALNNSSPTRILTLIIDDLVQRIESHRKTVRYPTDKKTQDKIARAKSVPIDSIIKFNRGGFAKCLWHKDTDPSMHYYAPGNIVKCFACSKYGDSIDVYMKVNKCGIKEALNNLAP